MQYEYEKEVFVEYVESTVATLKETIPLDEQLVDINNPEVRQTLLELVRSVKEVKETDIAFYNDLLKDLPYLEFFSAEVADLNQSKYFLSDSLNSRDNSINTQNFAELMKSSKIYYFINKKTTKNLSEEQLLEMGDLGLIKDYLQAVWPSAKQEELLGLLLYINSGKATDDYLDFLKSPKSLLKEKYLYDKFLESLHDLYVELNEEGNAFVELETRTRQGISSANRMDGGVVVDKENKKLYMGFATANYDTSDQHKQYFEKVKAVQDVTKNEDHALFGYQVIPAYITNSLLNENELKEGEREHKKEFLSLFSDNLTKEEKNKINCLSFLSLAGNIKMPDVNKGLDIKDFCLVNPYVSGADTLWIYNKFDQIKKMDSSNQQYFALRDLFINEASEVLTILDKKLPDFQLTYLNNQFGQVFKNVEKMITSSLELFHEGNLSSEQLYDQKFLEKVSEVGTLYKKIHKNKFNMAMPKDSNGMLGNTLYNSLRTSNGVQSRIESNNEDFLSIQADQNSYRENRKEKINNIRKDLTDIIPKIAQYFSRHEVNVFKKNLHASLEEILCVAQISPARDIKKLLNSAAADEQTFPHTKNFMQNYRYWEKNQAESRKNKCKHQIAEMLLENCRNPIQLVNVLADYEQKNNHKQLGEFKALATNPQRKKHYKELKSKFKNNENVFTTELSKFKKDYSNPDTMCYLSPKERQNRLVSYLKIKAEIIHDKNGNKNSVNAFNTLYEFTKEVGLEQDADVQKALEIARSPLNSYKKAKI